MAKDLLVEVGTEPLPARFVKSAAEQLAAKVVELLKGKGVPFKEDGIETYATLRRLAVLVREVGDKAKTWDLVVKGPPERLLRDEAGEFTPQAEGFAKKNGLAAKDLRVENGYIQAVVRQGGQETAELLRFNLMEAIRGLGFPKSMEWEESRLRFGRPIRSLVVLFGRQVVPVKIAGIKAGRLVTGLAALGGKPVSVHEPKRYIPLLKGKLVLADPAERRAALLKKLEAEARRAGGRADLDEDLVEETVYMTEHPVPVAGRFKKEYLALPPALLSLVMKKQLKFFPLLGKDGLLDTFLGVRDGVSEGQALVREGYQRVIAARLSDAAFFLSRDQATSLEAKLPGLERVTYQKSLGTMAQKGARVAKLSAWLCEALRQVRPVREDLVAQAARLCYADLVTEVVKEFPELQGAMGGWYARKDGLDERVAQALEQFYAPAGAKSAVPEFVEGAVVSLAGKLDSLAGAFAAGLAPTGSADPFALRRQALGAVRILLEKQLPVDLARGLREALTLQPLDLQYERVEELSRQLEDFAWGRAQTLFEELGFRIDEIRSVRPGGLAHLAQTLLRLSAIRSVRKDPDFEPLAAAFKRASNILKQAKAEDGGQSPERALLKEEAELVLYDSLLALEGKVAERLSQGDYESGLRTLVGIKPQLDRFFDGVMVMAEDPALRRQRLGLLSRLVRLFSSVADLSELQGPSAN